MALRKYICMWLLPLFAFLLFATGAQAAVGEEGRNGSECSARKKSGRGSATEGWLTYSAHSLDEGILVQSSAAGSPQAQTPLRERCAAFLPGGNTYSGTSGAHAGTAARRRHPLAAPDAPPIASRLIFPKHWFW
ncbi:MAG: hypothetical protein JNL72_06645 [Flavipsychrobacter sp.]|nr:hypothetical protein [Flavipsychrobacter sp.]